jgi:hypothetical protein
MESDSQQNINGVMAMSSQPFGTAPRTSAFKRLRISRTESHPPVLRRSVPGAEYSLHPAKLLARMNAIVGAGIDPHGAMPFAGS